MTKKKKKKYFLKSFSPPPTHHSIQYSSYSSRIGKENVACLLSKEMLPIEIMRLQKCVLYHAGWWEKYLRFPSMSMQAHKYPSLLRANYRTSRHTVRLTTEETVLQNKERKKEITYPQRPFDLVILHNLWGAVSFEHHLETNPRSAWWSGAGRTKMEDRNRKGWRERERPGSVKVK